MSGDNFHFGDFIIGFGLAIGIVLIVIVFGSWDGVILKDALTCDDIDWLIKENLKGNLEMNNNRFSSLIEAKIWCDEV